VGGFVVLTKEIMGEMWPHGDTKVPGLIDGIAAAGPTVFPKYGLTSDLLIAHAMAQFSHECGEGTAVVVNLNYSAQGLMNTWPSRFDAAKAAAFARNPEKIANEVYRGRNGNDPNSPDDGWNFRGRGAIQVTGRGNYDKLGKKIELDLIDKPELIISPEHFLECAVGMFVILGCLPFAAHDDVSGVTYHVNGGYKGLAERTAWLARWKAALNLRNADLPPHGPAWVQQSLNKLGTEPLLTVDGSFGPITTSAIRAFQRTHGLDADGKLGPLTIAAIEKALAGTVAD
jgi:putative chitinase